MVSTFLVLLFFLDLVIFEFFPDRILFVQFLGRENLLEETSVFLAILVLFLDVVFFDLL